VSDERWDNPGGSAGRPGAPTRGSAYSHRMAVDPSPGALGASAASGDVARLLAALPMATLVVDETGVVMRSSSRAEALGLVRRDVISVAPIVALVAETALAGVPQEREMRVRRPPLGRGMLDLRVTVTPLSSSNLAVLVVDLGEDRRVDAVRRDFVANVSHELKTPVGAMSLLAEAILSVPDEPAEVRRFAERMMLESGRLASLINDIIDLSRLQGSDPLTNAEVFALDPVISQAVDEMRTMAMGREIDLVVSLSPGAEMVGERTQILTALRNLISNALSYSASHTRVAIAARVEAGIVEVDVKDQGIGIPAQDLDRIFERFYRVDPARSRVTGGTGLGLSIVKHVCENHGGEVRVWSEVGVGSTFTLRLPIAPASTTPEDLSPQSQEETVS